MPEPVKVNVVSYGGVKPGQLIVGNGADGAKTTLFDAATATDGISRFYNCAGLTEWNVDLPNLTNGSNMFERAGIKTAKIDAPRLTVGTSMFDATSVGVKNCEKITITGAKIGNARRMFAYQSKLSELDMSFSYLSDGYDMFWDCNLPEPLVYKILTEIPTVTNSPTLSLGHRDNFSDSTRIAELLNTSKPLGAGPFTCKGWKIYVQ